MQRNCASALAASENAGLGQRYRMFVDGKFTDRDGEPREVINPATEEVLAEVDPILPSDVDTAVRAARRAYDRVWSRMPGAQRAKYLFRIARLVRERARDLAVWQSLESGTPIRMSSGVDAPGAAAHFCYYAGWADKLGYAGYGPDPRPIGVTGQLLSCDAPLLSTAKLLAPALSCGNTVVLKPSTTAPLTALELAEICRQAELPPGVLNVLPGTDDIGAALVAHDGLDKVVFTGAADTGRQIRHTLAGTRRTAALHLDGPTTTVVFEDAALAQAVEDVLTGPFAQGSGARLLVQEPVAEQVLAMLRTRVAGLHLGDPLAERTDIGPVRSRARLDRIRELTDSAETAGTRRWTSPAALPERGFYFSPTVFSRLSAELPLSRERLAGPVLPVLTFRTLDEALTQANITPASRCISIWTGSHARIRWAARHLRARLVWAHPGSGALADSGAAGGGYREAGAGPQPGRAGLEAYLDV
jgi:aldehyde dehydrogenase (NAD+)